MSRRNTVIFDPEGHLALESYQFVHRVGVDYALGRALLEHFYLCPDVLKPPGEVVVGP